MRRAADKGKLLSFMEEIGKRAKGPGRIYLVGGSSALLLDIRQQTIDIDIKLDPEPKEVFEAISYLKEALSLNIELAAPDQFMPPLPGWTSRSEFVRRAGLVEFFHYDFYSQVLAKVLRGHDRDLADATALVRMGKVDLKELGVLFEKIKPDLIRFPAIDPSSFQTRFTRFVESLS